MKVCLILQLYVRMSFVELQSSEMAWVFQRLPILPCQPGFNQVEHLSQWRYSWFGKWYYAQIRL